MDYLKALENEVAAWPGVSVHPHRFGGREFRFGTAEIGHTHETYNMLNALCDCRICGTN